MQSNTDLSNDITNLYNEYIKLATELDEFIHNWKFNKDIHIWVVSLHIWVVSLFWIGSYFAKLYLLINELEEVVEQNPHRLNRVESIRFYLIKKYIAEFCISHEEVLGFDLQCGMQSHFNDCNRRDLKAEDIFKKLKAQVNAALFPNIPLEEINKFYDLVANNLVSIRENLTKIDNKDDALNFMLTTLPEFNINSLNEANLYVPILLTDLLQIYLPRTVKEKQNISYHDLNETKRQSLPPENYFISKSVDQILFYVGATLAIGMTLGFVIPVYYLMQNKCMDRIHQFFNAPLPNPCTSLTQQQKTDIASMRTSDMQNLSNSKRIV